MYRLPVDSKKTFAADTAAGREVEVSRSALAVPITR